MEKLSFDYSKALSFFGEHEISYMEDQVKLAVKKLEEKNGPGNDFLGWLDLPQSG